MKHDPYKTIDSLLEEMAKDKAYIRRLEQELERHELRPSAFESAEEFAAEAFKLGELFKEEK